MTPKLLKTFLMVAHTGNITVAAARLNFAQSSVSDQIQSLELETGTALFERTREGMVLTSAGQALKPYAETVLATLDEARAALELHRQSQTVTLALGALETIAAQWLPAELSRLRENHPALDLTLQVANSAELIRLVREGSLDAAFCFNARPADPALACRTVAREPLVLIGGTVDGIGHTRGFVATRPGCVFRRIFDESIPAAHRSEARIIAEVDSIATIVSFVAKGVGVALVPRMAVAEALRRGEVAEVDWLTEDLHAALSLIWRRRRIQPPALSLLLDGFRSDQPMTSVAMQDGPGRETVGHRTA